MNVSFRDRILKILLEIVKFKRGKFKSVNKFYELAKQSNGNMKNWKTMNVQ